MWAVSNLANKIELIGRRYFKKICSLSTDAYPFSSISSDKELVQLKQYKS
jgi:hypothetical protein